MNLSRLAVIICSKGRADVLAETLESLSLQTYRPDEIILSVTGPEDLPDDLSTEIKIISGEPGLTRQLNRAVDSLDSTVEWVLFLDDDVELDEDYLQAAIECFRQKNGFVGLHGLVLHDAEISRQMAREALSSYSKFPKTWGCQRLYGCNMLIRRQAMEGFRFDERLPLYGWLFEIPFSRHLRARGGFMKSSACRLVHLRAKASRMGGGRFGYAQIANPLYLYRSQQINLWEMIFRYMFTALVSNTLKALSGSPERLRGNRIALGEWVDGRIDPERILKL